MSLKEEKWDPSTSSFEIFKIRFLSSIAELGMDHLNALMMVEDAEDPETKTDVPKKLNVATYSKLIKMIGITPTQQILNNRVEFGDGCSAWKALLKEYDSFDKDDAHPASQRLRKLSLSDCKSYDEYSYTFNKRYEDLVRALQQDKDETIKGLPNCLLRGQFEDGLPDSYSNIKTIEN